MMLSIEQCRALLPAEANLSDEEIGSLRDSLYATANVAFEAYWSDSDSGSKNPLGLLLHSQTEAMV